MMTTIKITKTFSTTGIIIILEPSGETAVTVPLRQ